VHLAPIFAFEIFAFGLIGARAGTGRRRRSGAAQVRSLAVGAADKGLAKTGY
jgi:hypothetical protein